jgi:hypothetical protein
MNGVCPVFGLESLDLGRSTTASGLTTRAYIPSSHTKFFALYMPTGLRTEFLALRTEFFALHAEFAVHAEFTIH